MSDIKITSQLEAILNTFAANNTLKAIDLNNGFASTSSITVALLNALLLCCDEIYVPGLTSNVNINVDDLRAGNITTNQLTAILKAILLQIIYDTDSRNANNLNDKDESELNVKSATTATNATNAINANKLLYNGKYKDASDLRVRSANYADKADMLKNGEDYVTADELYVEHANEADTAEYATEAGSATNADNATKAENANKLLCNGEYKDASTLTVGSATNADKATKAENAENLRCSTGTIDTNTHFGKFYFTDDTTSNSVGVNNCIGKITVVFEDDNKITTVSFDTCLTLTKSYNYSIGPEDSYFSSAVVNRKNSSGGSVYYYRLGFTHAPNNQYIHFALYKGKDGSYDSNPIPIQHIIFTRLNKVYF